MILKGRAKLPGLRCRDVAFIRQLSLWGLAAAIFIGIAATVVPSAPAAAQREGATKKVFLKIAKKALRRVVRKLGNVAMTCTAYGLYNLYQNHRYVCTDRRLGGKCLIPGYPGQDCPTFCNAGYWQMIGTTEEFWRETIEDCRPDR